MIMGREALPNRASFQRKSAGLAYWLPLKGESSAHWQFNCMS
jgi:hypothetical protein